MGSSRSFRVWWGFFLGDDLEGAFHSKDCPHVVFPRMVVSCIKQLGDFEFDSLSGRGHGGDVVAEQCGSKG